MNQDTVISNIKEIAMMKNGRPWFNYKNYSQHSNSLSNSGN